MNWFLFLGLYFIIGLVIFIFTASVREKTTIFRCFILGLLWPIFLIAGLIIPKDR